MSLSHSRGQLASAGGSAVPTVAGCTVGRPCRLALGLLRRGEGLVGVFWREGECVAWLCSEWQNQGRDAAVSDVWLQLARFGRTQCTPTNCSVKCHGTLERSGEVGK